MIDTIAIFSQKIKKLIILEVGICFTSNSGIFPSLLLEGNTCCMEQFLIGFHEKNTLGAPIAETYRK